MVLKHEPSLSCWHGFGSEHAQALRALPRGEVPKATPLARRAEMRSIIIIFISRVGAVCVCAPRRCGRAVVSGPDFTGCVWG